MSALQVYAGFSRLQALIRSRQLAFEYRRRRETVVRLQVCKTYTTSQKRLFLNALCNKSGIKPTFGDFSANSEYTCIHFRLYVEVASFAWLFAIAGLLVCHWYQSQTRQKTSEKRTMRLDRWCSLESPTKSWTIRSWWSKSLDSCLVTRDRYTTGLREESSR